MKKTKHGIDCPCKECQEVRGFLKSEEQKGKIHLVGVPKDLEKIRK